MTSVIPAQAGIQQKEIREADKTRFCHATQGWFNYLDSRLRGNDKQFWRF